MMSGMVRISRGAAFSCLTVASVVGSGAALAFFTDEGRAPAHITDASGSHGGRELRLTIATCKGRPEVAVISEGSTEVVVEVISDVHTGAQPACVDSVSVRLGNPLGDRNLGDTTGDRVWVPRDQRT